MRDITNKPDSLRSARAQARLRMPEACVTLIRDNQVGKGDPREAARMAAFMAAKKTWELLPHCHPLPLHKAEVEFELQSDGLLITVEVATVAPTGVEMEALTAASIAALTVYDMLKPHAGLDLQIEAVQLLEKLGGKSDFARILASPASALVVTCSDAVSSGAKPDAAGQILRDALTTAGFSPIEEQVLSDDPEAISAAVRAALDKGVSLIATVGGTGVNPGDCAVEAVSDLIDQLIPGIPEAARAFGQTRTPYAMMSRAIAGRTGKSLLVTFPGSRGGVSETWAAIGPGLVHAVEVIRRTRS